jgi:prevent-host-death family protein
VRIKGSNLLMPYNIKEAKENIDLILNLAESGRPQVIKRGEKEVAVIVSVEDWNILKPQEQGIPSVTEKNAAGMTVNERLYLSGLMDEFDAAVAARDRPRISLILKKVYLDQSNIDAIIGSVIGKE